MCIRLFTPEYSEMACMMQPYQARDIQIVDEK